MFNGTGVLGPGRPATHIDGASETRAPASPAASAPPSSDQLLPSGHKASPEARAQLTLGASRSTPQELVDLLLVGEAALRPIVATEITASALTLLHEQAVFYRLDTLRSLPIRNPVAFTRLLVGLRAAGGEAVARIMGRLGFVASEIEFGRRLVTENAVTQYLSGQVALAPALEAFQRFATDVNAKPADLFWMMQLLQVSGTPYIAHMRDEFFEPAPHGKLLPQDARLRYLEAALGVKNERSVPQVDIVGRIPLSYTEDSEGRPGIRSASAMGGAVSVLPTAETLVAASEMLLEVGTQRGHPRARLWALDTLMLLHGLAVSPVEGEALRSYVNNGFIEINRYLRGEDLQLPAETMRIIARDAQAIRNVLSRVPRTPFELTLYRGSPVGQRAIPKVGDVWVDGAVHSTSVDVGVAEIYTMGVPGKEYPGAWEERQAWNQTVKMVADLHGHARAEQLPDEGILFVYHLPKGSGVLPLSYFRYYEHAGVANQKTSGNINTEAEVLIRGGKFEVVAVEPAQSLAVKVRGPTPQGLTVTKPIHVVHLRPPA